MTNASANGQAPRKLLAAFPQGGEASKNPAYTCCSENGLGLRELLRDKGFDVIVTSDKDGPDSEFEKHIADTEIVVTTPFHPGQLTADRIKKGEKLKLLLTAGIGSDHVDLHAAADMELTVAEVQGSNNTSVAEDEVMRILMLMRNFIPAYNQIQKKVWDVPATAGQSWDLMGKTVGTLGGGRIGYETLLRLENYGCNLVYYGRREKPDMKKVNAKLYTDLKEFLQLCDVVTINLPLSDKTRGMFDAKTIDMMKDGAFLVNNARGAIVDAKAVADACNSGKLGGYSGDVWDTQPPSKDHPWFGLRHGAMTAHTSGTTLDAQKRYQEGIHTMINQYLKGEDFEEDFYIVKGGSWPPLTCRV